MAKTTFISITNICKYDLVITMFCFYDHTGAETHMTLFLDSQGRLFGGGNLLVRDSSLFVNEVNLYSYTPMSYNLKDIELLLME